MNFYRIHKDHEQPHVRHIYWLHNDISPLTLADALDQHEELFVNIHVQRDVEVYVSKSVHRKGSRVSVVFARGDNNAISKQLDEIVEELFKGNVI